MKPSLQLLRLEGCLSSILVAFASTACDSVESGHLEDPETPPMLVRLLIQDEDLFGGRFIATDLLRDADPMDPSNECSTTDPCPGELGQFCSIEEGASKGFCVDPLNPRISPPAIGLPVAYGGNQIRLVFDQGLDSEVEAQLQEVDDTTVMLRRGQDAVDVVKYLDNSGSPTYSVIPIFEPFGPAIVLKPTASLVPLATYSISLEPSRIRDRDGLYLVDENRGPYTFTMEGFYIFGAAPDIVTSTSAVIAPNSVIQFSLNAPVDEDTLNPIGTSTGTNLPIEVRDANMSLVSVRAWVDRGSDPSSCDAGRNPRLIDIVRTSSIGQAIDWEPGSYVLTIRSVEAAESDAVLRADASGTELTVSFGVGTERADPTSDPSAIEGFVLPEACM